MERVYGHLAGGPVTLSKNLSGVPCVDKADLGVLVAAVHPQHIVNSIEWRLIGVIVTICCPSNYTVPDLNIHKYVAHIG